MDGLSDDELRHVVGFMDGHSLIAWSGVCTRSWDMTMRRIVWRDVAMRMFPHLRETRDASAYGGDWRALVVDQNRRNRSMVFISRFARISTDATRRYGSTVSVGDYSFHVIVDPVGNPNMLFDQPMLSVYVGCSSPNDTDWECCCQFSITAINQRGHKNKTWHSTLPDHRFSKRGVRSWGVHEFMPRGGMGGFVVDDAIKIRVKMRLLYIRVCFEDWRMDIFASTRMGRLRELIGLGDCPLWAVCGSSAVLLDNDDASVYSMTSHLIIRGLNEITISCDNRMVVRRGCSPSDRFLRLEHLVNFFAACGGDPRRMAEVYFDRAHQDPNEALRYVMQGRNLGYCCDQCGTPDFIGLLYHCEVCPDYDLCEGCANLSSIMPHRYRVSKKKGFDCIRSFPHHTREHRMSITRPLFYKACASSKQSHPNSIQPPIISSTNPL